MVDNFEPEVAPETPFPNQIAQSSTQSSGSTLTPTTKENPVPVKRTAVELLSTALNTRSRKILQSFELQQSGGFQIGNFEEGLSGDLRVTPGGITARNIAGLTTFSIDGDTGDAVFAGQLRSGSTVTGSVTIEENGYILLGSSIFIGDINNV